MDQKLQQKGRGSEDAKVGSDRSSRPATLEALRSELVKALEQKLELHKRRITGNVKQTHLFSKNRREIARLKTWIHMSKGDGHGN